MVKFGSYDPTGLADGGKLNMLKTIDKTTWALAVKSMDIIGLDYSNRESVAITNDIQNLEGKQVFLEP